MADALRAEWYDLEPGAEEGFIAWLHGDHLPRLQRLPGVRWIGHYRIADKAGSGAHDRQETREPVPPGRGFVLLTAAGGDLLLTPDPALAALDAMPRLADRRNWREAVFVEETRVDGPAAGQHDRARAAPPAMQLGNFIVSSPAGEKEMARFYRRHRLPQCAATAGCIGARKLVSAVGWPKHGILYEFIDMGEGDTLFEARMNAAIPGARWEGTHPLKLVIHAPHAPHAGRRIWPAA
jgi:hypothetical protein